MASSLPRTYRSLLASIASSSRTSTSTLPTPSRRHASTYENPLPLRAGLPILSGYAPAPEPVMPIYSSDLADPPKRSRLAAAMSPPTPSQSLQRGSADSIADVASRMAQGPGMRIFVNKLSSNPAAFEALMSVQRRLLERFSELNLPQGQGQGQAQFNKNNSLASTDVDGEGVAAISAVALQSSISKLVQDEEMQQLIAKLNEELRKSGIDADLSMVIEGNLTSGDGDESS